jgi:hypothetical protein
MTPERENLPLVKLSRALDRVVARIKEREMPEAEDLIIAADWIDQQRMRNLARGLFECCDECGAHLTKYGCPNCLRKALEELNWRTHSKYDWNLDPENITLLVGKALATCSPNEKLCREQGEGKL